MQAPVQEDFFNFIQLFNTDFRTGLAVDCWSRDFNYDEYKSYVKKHPLPVRTLTEEEYKTIRDACELQHSQDMDIKANLLCIDEAFDIGLKINPFMPDEFKKEM